MSHVINNRALTGEKQRINKAIHAFYCMATQLSICVYRGHRIGALTRCIVHGPRTSIVGRNCVRETSVKRRSKIVQEIMQNVANIFTFYAIIANEHGFIFINIRLTSGPRFSTPPTGPGQC